MEINSLYETNINNKFNFDDEVEIDEYNNSYYFEEDYEDIKTNPNILWFKYEEKIKKVINNLSYNKNFDPKDLMQEAYIYFIEFCAIYDPYYAYNFIPFDRYIFKNLIIKLRSYIQRFYFKVKREQPSELSDYQFAPSRNNISELEGDMYVNFLYSLISESQRQILDLSVKGYKQREIGDILGISQSRVSVIKNKTLKKLHEYLKTNKMPKKKAKKF